MKKTIQICDRCGRECRPNDAVKYNITKLNLFCQWVTKVSKYDLCDDCAKAFEDFMEMRGERE